MKAKRPDRTCSGRAPAETIGVCSCVMIWRCGQRSTPWREVVTKGDAAPGPSPNRGEQSRQRMTSACVCMQAQVCERERDTVRDCVSSLGHMRQPQVSIDGATGWSGNIDATGPSCVIQVRAIYRVGVRCHSKHHQLSLPA